MMTALGFKFIKQTVDCITRWPQLEAEKCAGQLEVKPINKVIYVTN